MTPLLKRIVIEQRPVVLPLVALVLLNLLAYAFVVRPRGLKAAGAADRAAVAASAVGAAERAHATARDLVAGKARADEELTTFYTDILPASHQAAVRMTYSSLPALARRTGVAWARRTSEIDAAGDRKDETLGHLAMTMVLQGSYEHFREFVQELENAPEFLIVDDVALSEGNADAQLTFVITLSTYFRLGSHGS